MAFALWNGKDLFCPTCADSGRKAPLKRLVNRLAHKCSNGHQFSTFEVMELKNNNLVEAK